MAITDDNMTIERLMEALGQLREQLAEKDKIIELLHESNKDLDDVCVRLAEAEAKVEKARELAASILDFAEHGDYSNGNNADFALDEGRYMAGNAMVEYREQIAALSTTPTNPAYQLPDNSLNAIETEENVRLRIVLAEYKQAWEASERQLAKYYSRIQELEAALSLEGTE